MAMHRRHVAHDFELNLTPIIDCFVTLICFLLLSATYVNLVGMDAKVPVAVLTAAPNKDETKFKLELEVRPGYMELIASGAGALSGKKRIPMIGGKPDLATLHVALVKIKTQRPKEFSIHFNSEIDMPYEDLVRYMDSTRNLDPKDPTFTITDERNGKPVKVDTLFPDFVMANLAALPRK